jgi:TonB family protein
MRKPFLTILMLSLVITAKANQTNKPADLVSVTAPNNQQQVAPEPAGGIDVFNRYMKKYTNHQYNNDQAGTVTLSFIVQKDGSLAGYKIVHSLNKEADDLTLQVLKDYNQKWKPAMQNGQPVDAPYTITVPFGK